MAWALCDISFFFRKFDAAQVAVTGDLNVDACSKLKEWRRVAVLTIGDALPQRLQGAEVNKKDVIEVLQVQCCGSAESVILWRGRLNASSRLVG